MPATSPAASTADRGLRGAARRRQRSAATRRAARGRARRAARAAGRARRAGRRAARARRGRARRPRARHRASARPSETFPSGSTGTASASASPSAARERGDAAAASARARAASRAGRTGSSAAVQPAKPPASDGGAARAAGRAGRGDGSARAATCGGRRGAAAPRSAARELGRGRRRCAGRPTATRSTSSSSALRQVGPKRRERRRARLDRARRVEHRRLPERVPARERLPEHHADRPDVGRGGRRPRPRAARARCTRACPARRPARSASPPRPSARARSRAAAPTTPSPSASSTFDGFTSRWRIPRRVRVRERRRRSARRPRSPRASSSSPARSASRNVRPGHVLVRDVDVARVARERVGAQAARVAEPRRRRGLALGARGRLALAGDDLQRDSSPVCSSRASQTDPEPPLPSGRSGRYRLRTSPSP